jgi:protein TonB
MFDQSFVPTGGSRRWTILVALLGQFILVGILVVIPLMYVQVLPVPEVMSRVLLAPPPPPPPPPPPAPARREPPKIVARKFDPTKLTAPSTIPKQVTIQNETAEALPQAPGIAGVRGGVPGGIPGGIPGGALNSLLSSAPPPPPPVAAKAPEPPPPDRIRVGGDVQAGLLVREIAPSYPKLAAMAHIAGTVRLKAVIGRDGSVEDLTLISGHPLLIQAAEAAVKQWIYKPTLLNGLPVEVDTEIDVHFVQS